MDKIQKFFEIKLPQYIWGGLGCMSLAGVIFAGAWWHLTTAVISGLMYFACKSDDYEDDEQ